MKIRLLACFLTLLFSISAEAGITLNGTRVVFNGNKTETAITVNNPDKTSYLIQSWISKDDKKAADFIVTPPLFRIDGNTSNVLRIVLAKNNLPKDKESLFWLNVKAIPPSDPNAKDSLLIAINTKIKLIYRPVDLIGKESSLAYQKLKFVLDTKSKKLIASNPTAYYVTLSDLTLNSTKIENPGMIAPFSSAQWKVNIKGAVGNVQWRAVNDFGGKTETEHQQLMK